MVQTTPAKSLMYECVSCIASALPFVKRSDGSVPKAVPGMVAMCNEKLREMVEDNDQNLKYLGLVGYGNLMRSQPARHLSQHELLISIYCT